MSCSYAEGLSPYDNKGTLGLKEEFDSEEEVDRKVKLLCSWMEEADRVVFHTGAGISTAAGIPDFRGPKGVWTLEKKGIKPEMNTSFDDAVPTLTHMAITELVKRGKIQYVVSQNIDALHLKSGLGREHLAELHGNMFVDQCNKCERQFVRKHATSSVGQKSLNVPCPYAGKRPCRGVLHDTVLDWEHNLPQKDINMGDYNSSIADVSVSLGTTLQINPSGLLPGYTKKYNNGKVVICNLQRTQYDKCADLVIRAYVDEILSKMMRTFGLRVPAYDETLDPTRFQTEPYQLEWTIKQSDVYDVKRKYEEKMRANKERKRLLMDAERELKRTKIDDIAKDVKRTEIDNDDLAKDVKRKLKRTSDDVAKNVGRNLKRTKIDDVPKENSNDLDEVARSLKKEFQTLEDSDGKSEDSKLDCKIHERISLCVLEEDVKCKRNDTTREGNCKNDEKVFENLEKKIKSERNELNSTDSELNSRIERIEDSEKGVKSKENGKVD